MVGKPVVLSHSRTPLKSRQKIGLGNRPRDTRFELVMKYVALILLIQISWLGAEPPADFNRGQQFPQIELRSISSPEKIAIKDQLGEKLMLHLFASW
jgi:hypothetical protein